MTTDEGGLVLVSSIGGYSNPNIQALDDTTALTYWNENDSPNPILLLGHGYGSVQILDSTYKA